MTFAADGKEPVERAVPEVMDPTAFGTLEGIISRTLTAINDRGSPALWRLNSSFKRDPLLHRFRQDGKKFLALDWFGHIVGHALL